MRFHLQILLAVVTLFAATSVSAGLENMRGPLFAKTNEARAEADSFQAQQLAPLSYKQAAEYYDRAEAHFSRGATSDSIRSALTKSRKLFKPISKIYCSVGKPRSAASAPR
jgi:hypothetical protein